MTDPNPHGKLIRELTARSSPREALIRDVTARIGDRKTAESLVAAFYRATKDERGNRPDTSAQVERIVAAYECLVVNSRPAPKTIRDLACDLSGIDDVDDAINAAIPEGATLLSPDFTLTRSSMVEARRRLLSNDDDIVSDAEFAAWGLRVGGGDPEGDLLALHDQALCVVRDAVVALLMR